MTDPERTSGGTTTAGRAAEYAKGKGSGRGSEAYRGGTVEIEDRARFDKAIAGINKALAKRNEAGYQAAIEIAADFWGVEVNDLTYSPTYGPGSAVTKSWSSGAIQIIVGPGGTSDAEWLISTMGHEGVHVGQIRDGNFLPEWDEAPNAKVQRARDVAHAVNEVEACDFELARGRSVGLTGAQIRQVNSYRSDWLGELKGTLYYNRVLNGNYSLK